MKRAFPALTLALLAIPCSAKQLTILHTNDLHSHIGAHGPGGRYGGYDRVAEVINEIRATTPNVLLLDAGDWIEGSFYFRFNQPAAVDPEEWCGTADLSVMKAMGYNCIVLGNHDYIDYNHTYNNGTNNSAPDTVVQRFQRANIGGAFPILSYNFIPTAAPAGPLLDPYLVNEGDAQPFALLNVNGVTVAIAGMSEELFVYQMYLTDSSLKDPTAAGYAQGVIDAMNTVSPDVTMLLNHVGHGTDQQLAAASSGCDVIVGGHSHSVLFSVDDTLDSQGKPVHIVQAGSQGLYVGRLDLNIDDTTKVVTVTNYQLIPVDQNTPSDPTVGAKVSKLRNSVITKNGNVFGDSVATMTVDIGGGTLESSVGNLIVDGVFAKTSGAPYNADMAWISNGAVSNPGDIILDGLRKGNVRSEDVYRVYGHGYNPVADANFRIFLVDYTGAQIRFLQETFNFGDLVASLGQGLFINMAGGQVTYDPTLPDGARITSFLVGGQPLVDTQTYTLAVGEGELQTLDYVYDKGLLTFTYTNLRPTAIQVWTAMKDYLAAASPVAKTAVDIEGRYRTVQPDLCIANYGLSVTPATYKVGDTVNVNVLVENFGEAASTGATVEVYRDKTPYDWSDDPSYDATSLIGTVTVPPVGAFPATTTVNVPWTVTGVAPGNVPLYVRLTGVTGEQNNTNHFAFGYSDGLTVPWRILASTGPGPSNAPQTKVFAGLGTPDVVGSFSPYTAGGYGNNVTAGDIDGTSTDDEIITGAGPGPVYGPQFRGFKLSGTPIAKVNAYAYGTLRYGVNVAGGDVEGDGYSEIVTGAGPGAVFGPHVRAFNFDGTVLTAIQKVSFFAYGTLKYGVNVATGQMDADLPRELLTAPGPGTIFGPQIRGFNYDGAAVTSIGKINFNAFPVTGYGARVAAGDVDSDGYDEILAAKGPGPAHTSDVGGFDYDGTVIAAIPGINYVAFPGYLYGAKVAAGDVDADAYAEILASPGPDPAAQARISGKNVDTATPLGPRDLFFLAFDPEKYGCNVAFAELAP